MEASSDNDSNDDTEDELLRRLSSYDVFELHLDDDERIDEARAFCEDGELERSDSPRTIWSCRKQHRVGSNIVEIAPTRSISEFSVFTISSGSLFVTIVADEGVSELSDISVGSGYIGESIFLRRGGRSGGSLK